MIRKRLTKAIKIYFIEPFNTLKQCEVNDSNYCLSCLFIINQSIKTLITFDITLTSSLKQSKKNFISQTNSMHGLLIISLITFPYQTCPDGNERKLMAGNMGGKVCCF